MIDNKNNVVNSLFRQVDSSSLAFFRMAFGAIMLWEVVRYFQYGWINEYWVKPSFHFAYDGFSWVQPWAGNGMYIHFAVLGLLAAFIMLGLFYRASMVGFFVGFTYVFLLDKTTYLNHFYLISLLSFLLIFTPANGSFSLDSKLFPKQRKTTTPQWAVWLLAFQVGIAYFYGGIAKINADWLLQGEPLRTWMAAKTDIPLIGQYFTSDWIVMLFAWGGMAFDLAIVPLLVFKRTRWFGVGLLVFFHLTNSSLFEIGIFPWFMLAATGLFFPPDWFKKLSAKLGFGQKPGTSNIVTKLGSLNVQPRLAALTLSMIGIWALIQVAVPLRHFLIPGNVHWTEEGHRFSWHMKLRDKTTRAKFLVRDSANQQEWVIQPTEYLTQRQALKMASRPDMLWQFSQYLRSQYIAKGYSSITVHAVVLAALNGRDEQLLINPEMDLSTVIYDNQPADWILPLLAERNGKKTQLTLPIEITSAPGNATGEAAKME